MRLPSAGRVDRASEEVIGALAEQRTLHETLRGSGSTCARLGPVLRVSQAHLSVLVGSNLMRRCVPVALANRCSVLPEEMLRPLSMRAIALCEVSIFSASCSCVRPARVRARRKREFVIERFVLMTVLGISQSLLV